MLEAAVAAAAEIGYPLVVRPSYVLGGRAMEIVHSRVDLAEYMAKALEALDRETAQTILLDEFLEDAIEVDVEISWSAIREHLTQEIELDAHLVKQRWVWGARLRGGARERERERDRAHECATSEGSRASQTLKRTLESTHHLTDPFELREPV